MPSAAPSSNVPLSSSLALREVVWSRSRCGILFANFTAENMGNVAVRDWIVTCVAYGASGTPIDSAAITRYDVLEAKTAREYEGIEIGPTHSQVAAVRCLAREP